MYVSGLKKGPRKTENSDSWRTKSLHNITPENRLQKKGYYQLPWEICRASYTNSNTGQEDSLSFIFGGILIKIHKYETLK